MLDSACIGDCQDNLHHFAYGLVCRVSGQAALAMSTQVKGNDREVFLEASDIARFMPLLALAASTVQQHDRWPSATTIICNPDAIW